MLESVPINGRFTTLYPNHGLGGIVGVVQYLSLKRPNYIVAGYVILTIRKGLFEHCPFRDHIRLFWYAVKKRLHHEHSGLVNDPLKRVDKPVCSAIYVGEITGCIQVP